MSAAAAPPPRTSRDALLAARELLGPPGAWLPGRSFGAVDSFGRTVAARSGEAVRWGVAAALRRGGGSDAVRSEAFALLHRGAGVPWFPRWEEAPARAPAEVLRALDDAAALAGLERAA